MVSRFVPLPIDVWVTALGGAGLRCEEEVGWNQRAGLCFDGSREEVSGCATAFLIHTRGRECWIFNEICFIW